MSPKDGDLGRSHVSDTKMNTRVESTPPVEPEPPWKGNRVFTQSADSDAETEALRDDSGSDHGLVFAAASVCALRGTLPSSQRRATGL